MAKVANKVQLGDETLIDLTGDTVTESDVVSGKTFHGADGKPKTGNAEYAPLNHLQTLANGGTGQNFADFAALSDAVGSGGNWIDVSTKFRNELTISSSDITITHCDAFIYEKRFMHLSVFFTCSNALSAGSQKHTFTAPSWAFPKTYVGSGQHVSVAQYYPSGDCLVHAHLPISAGGIGLGLEVFFALATPYSE